MRQLNRCSVSSIRTRAAGVTAVLALAIQPCVACLACSGATTTFAAPSHAPAHGAADACPSLSARGPEAYVPTAAETVLGFMGPSAPISIAIPAPSFGHAPACPDGLANDRVPLFLRHASFRL